MGGEGRFVRISVRLEVVCVIFDGIFFEPTRIEKLQRIALTGCAYFVDDLQETFEEELFPERVGKILYTTNDLDGGSLNVRTAGDWDHISEYLFYG